MALSSAEPADFPLPRTALELGFDLIALRALCKRQSTAGDGGDQGRSGLDSAICGKFREDLQRVVRARVARAPGSGVQYDSAVHLRMPSIDHGVQSFIWALLFFLILWFGMLLIGVSDGTALILSLVAAGAIFLFIRVNGEDRPGPPV